MCSFTDLMGVAADMKGRSIVSAIHIIVWIERDCPRYAYYKYMIIFITFINALHMLTDNDHHLFRNCFKPFKLTSFTHPFHMTICLTKVHSESFGSIWPYVTLRISVHVPFKLLNVCAVDDLGFSHCSTPWNLMSERFIWPTHACFS